VLFDPGNLLDYDRLTAAAIDAPHGVQQKNQNSPEGDELEPPFGVVLSASLPKEVTAAGKAGPNAGSGNEITLAAAEFEVPVENVGDGADTRKLVCGRHLHTSSGGCIEVRCSPARSPKGWGRTSTVVVRHVFDG
jgi:hypothetical protein